MEERFNKETKTYKGKKTMMVRAGALYFAIIMALFIAVVTTSLLLLAAHYSNSYLKELRFTRLLNNLDAGQAFALTPIDSPHHLQKVDLYGDGADSLIVLKKEWGIYEQIILQAFIQNDTLTRAMLIGTETDSLALYLSDENRPLSLGGKAKIVGNVRIPKSGIKKAYVDGKAYVYEKLVNDGQIDYSVRRLPQLDTLLLNRLSAVFQKKDNYSDLTELPIKQSFLKPTLYFDVSENAVLEAKSFAGNIIISSDSTLTIKASCKLDGVQIYAPSIIIESGFKGNCQLFALESIVIKDKVHLSYPSVAAVLKTAHSEVFPKVALGKAGSFEGVIFTHEPKRSALQTMISLDSAASVKGELYAGILKLTETVVIEGKISCNSLMMQSKQVLYENFLIDLTLNRNARSKYYLSSPVFNTRFPYQVLKWLD